MKRRIVCLAVLFLFCSAQLMIAETIRECIKRDANFPIYSVIFGITLEKSGKLKDLRIDGVIDPRSGTADPVQVDVPAEYFENAKKRITATKYEPSIENGKPVEFYTYFYYSPLCPAALIDNLDSDIETLAKPNNALKNKK